MWRRICIRDGDGKVTYAETDGTSLVAHPKLIGGHEEVLFKSDKLIVTRSNQQINIRWLKES